MNVKKIYNICSNILIFILIISCISSIGTKLVTGKSSVFGYRPIFVLSESMEPTISKYQFCIGIPASPDNIQVGDIVTYTLKNDSLNIQPTIVHRIIDVDGQGNYIFKGDNNTSADILPVSPSDIGYKIIIY